MLTLAIIFFVIAIAAACGGRRDADGRPRPDLPTAAAATTGAILFFIAAIMKGSDDRDC
jgi:hypothetical protein